MDRRAGRCGGTDGDWEIVQFADAVLTGSQTYRLTHVLAALGLGTLRAGITGASK